MGNEITEMQKHNIFRLSNEESNRLTRECLQTALIKLLSQKPIEKISITELTGLAGVSRTAFYSNFETKEDILISWSDEFIDRLSSLAREGLKKNNLSDMFKKLFLQFLANKDDVDVLLRAGMQNLLFNAIETNMLEHVPATATSARYLLSGWCGMFKYIVLRWYADGMKDSADQMAILCADLSDNFIREVQKIYPAFLEDEYRE